MTINNGIMGRFHFGGEYAHTSDHPPLIFIGKKKAGTGEFKAGLLVAMDDAGEMIPHPGTGSIAGVCDELCPADTVDCPYLVHGTVKAHLLAKAGDVPLEQQDLAALHAAGIFPL